MIISKKSTRLVGKFLETVDSLPGNMPVMARFMMVGFLSVPDVEKLDSFEPQNPPAQLKDSSYLRKLILRFIAGGGSDTFIVQALAYVVTDFMKDMLDRSALEIAERFSESDTDEMVEALESIEHEIREPFYPFTDLATIREMRSKA